MGDDTIKLVTALITIFGAIFGGTGLWSYLSERSKSKRQHADEIAEVRRIHEEYLSAFTKEYSDSMQKMSNVLIGLGHDKIVYLGMEYLERGSITHDEYENLHDYLYKPYQALGGNGTAEAVMEDVKRLRKTKLPERKKK